MATSHDPTNSFPERTSSYIFATNHKTKLLDKDKKNASDLYQSKFESKSKENVDSIGVMASSAIYMSRRRESETGIKHKHGFNRKNFW